MSKNRRRSATANDVDLKTKKRTTTVDILNAFGGVEEEAEEAEEVDRFRARSVDFIRERQAKEKKRSSSIDIVVDDLVKTFMKSATPKPKSRSTSVDILNAFGGIAEESEEDES